MNRIINLIGCALDSKEVQDCVKEFGEAPDIFDDGVVLYQSFQRHGVCLLFRNQRLGTVMFYSKGLDGFSEFVGPLPFNLNFQDDKQAVEQKIGAAVVSSGSVQVPFPGRHEANWIKFRLEKYALHIEFTSTACEAIRLVTVMTPKPSDLLN